MAEARKTVTDDLAASSDADEGEASGPGRSGAWSQDDIETLIEMWHMHYSNREIGDVLERKPNAVAIKASRLSLPPRRLAEEARKTGKTRPCLRCRTPFHSEGAGHRICDVCKGSADWTSGGGDYFVAMDGC